LERVNEPHFWNPGVFSNAMIPRCHPNKEFFFFFIVTSIVYAQRWFIIICNASIPPNFPTNKLLQSRTANIYIFAGEIINTLVLLELDSLDDLARLCGNQVSPQSTRIVQIRNTKAKVGFKI
jgi:hypothetical protein